MSLWLAQVALAILPALSLFRRQLLRGLLLRGDLLFAAALVASPAVNAAMAEPVAPQDVVFTGVHVLRPDLGLVLRDRSLWVQSGVIRAIVNTSELPLPEHAHYIAADGWYVIPGLYEMHAHIPSQAQGEVWADDVLRLFLSQGVTTVRGMLGEPWHLRLREELAQGQRVGPRLLTSGPSFSGQSVDSPRQAERRVAAQAQAGYDFIKLHPGLGPLEYETIIRAARRAGLPIAGHVSLAVGLTRTLRARQDSIEHLDGYAQELLAEDSPLRQRDPGFFGIAIASGLRADRIQSLAQSTARAGVWNVPTQSLLENILGDTPVDTLMKRPALAYVSAETRQQWRQALLGLREEYRPNERHQFLLIRRLLIVALAEAGAGLVLGSDAPQIMNVPGFSLHQELSLMVAAGLSPQQALLMGTTHAAQYLGEQQTRGLVAPGYQADLVFLGANPNDGIEQSQNITGVFHQGRWYPRLVLDAWLEEIRQHQQKVH